jgi:hypothetical protein
MFNGSLRLPFAPVHHCWSCGAAVDPLHAAREGGVCDRFECRAAWGRRREEEEARTEALRRGAAGEALREAGFDPDTVSWSPTPANPAELVPLAAWRRERFIAHLRRIVEEAVRDDRGSGPRATPETDEGESPFTPPGAEERRALAAGCAACRGWCCRRGGTHAFLEPVRIRRLFEQRPTLTAQDVVELYASHLGDHHLEGGCVFQGDEGCRLPREIRGDTCNRYYCSDLDEARRGWRRRDLPGPHHFVAVTRADGSPLRARTIDVPDV